MQPQTHAGDSKVSVEHGHGLHLQKSIIIDRPAAELYAFWRNFANLPSIMTHLKSVQVTDQRRSHWVVTAPANTQVEWDAEVINDVPNERIGWRSLDNAQVDNAGSVVFTELPGDRGTKIDVTLQYDPPAGKAGAAIAKLFGEAPDQQITEDLRHFKQLFETGVPTTTEGQPSGRTKSKQS